MAEYLQVLLSLMHSALLPDEKLIDPPDPGGHLLNTALSQMCCLMSPPPHKSVSPPPHLQLHTCALPSPRSEASRVGAHAVWSALN